jgi:hypothetical protein
MAQRLLAQLHKAWLRAVARIGRSTASSATVRAGRSEKTTTRLARNKASSTSCHQQHRKACALPQLQQLGLHGQPGQRIELAQRLVQDQQLRLIDQGARQRARWAMPPESWCG